MPLFIKAIDPELQVLGPAQQFKFDLNLASMQFDNTFVPTSLIPSQNNSETRNSGLSGFRWVHITEDGDTFGTLKLQSFVNASPTGTDIMTFNQAGEIIFNSGVIIHIPPIIEVDGTSQTFRYDGASEADFILQNTFAATMGTPSYVDVHLTNSTTGGYRIRHTSSTTDTSGIGTFELDLRTSTGTHTPIFTVVGTGGSPASTLNVAALTTFTQNLGLGGVTASHAPLQFPNTISNRLLILNEVGNNDNQFAGLGINTSTGVNIFRCQIADSTDRYEWWSGSIFSLSYKLMTLQGTGGVTLYDPLSEGNPALTLKYNQTNVNAIIIDNINKSATHTAIAFTNNGSPLASINYNASTSQLSILSSATSPVCEIGTSASNLIFTDSDATFNNGVIITDPGMGFANLLLESAELTATPLALVNTNPAATYFALSFGNGTSEVADMFYNYSTETLSIRASETGATCHIGTQNSYLTFSDSDSNAIFNQNLGIGGVTPNAPLQFNNPVMNRVISLFDGTNNDHQYFGFGINSSTLRYQISDTASENKWYAGASSSTSNLLMSLQGTGDLIVQGTYYGKRPYVSAYLATTSSYTLTGGTALVLGGTPGVTTYTVNNNNQFTFLSSGPLIGSFQYTSSVVSPVSAVINANITANVSAITGILSAIIYINGSFASTAYPVSVTMLGTTVSLSITTGIQMATNDYVSIYLLASSTTNITVTGANFVITTG